MGIPCKTAAGHAELASQDCRLSKRHRVLLLLVDGERSLDDVVLLGRQVGVPQSYIDELFSLGLIVIGPPHSQTISEFACLDPDSTLPLPSVVEDSEPEPPDAREFDVAQARGALLDVLLSNVPVTGMVTMIRVRRVQSRAELRALLPEVQARLSRSRSLVEARQLLQRVESLLAVR
ncbi:hypothetical protein [uncultured Sphaerotilus sp.]|uniref:hypothetical protein n=1 Tax=uncultured Sphaerotilus sp. TaxID=474984 RepID=UPI0030CA1364